MKVRIRIAVYAACALVVAVLVVSSHVAPYAVPSFASVQAAWRASDAWLLDRHGEPLSRIRVDHTRRRGEWVHLADVSPAMVAAVIASDARHAACTDANDGTA